MISAPAWYVRRAASGYHWSQQMSTPMRPGFGVERLIAQVAGGKVEFFFKPGILRNMHLAVHAQERTVRIHHPGGIVVKPGGTLFKAGGNNHHAQFRRQFPVGFRQFPGNRFRQVE